MAREPKVVDVESVDRGKPLRRLLLLLLLAIAAAGLYVFRQSQDPPGQPAAAEATGVRSTVAAEGDSLQVAVAWEFLADSGRAAPESVRVEVGLSGGQQTSVSTSPAGRSTDTLRVAAPAPGQVASGYSCVAPIHRGQLRRESCTPWQFVLPAADTMSAPLPDSTQGPRAARSGRPDSAARVTRVVVQPVGLQVDPDPDGRCARWQRANPGRSVWVEVNSRAVPECTGANDKPMVAQFCAFAELQDGRRVMTKNSEGNAYCARLYRTWAAERVS